MAEFRPMKLAFQGKTRKYTQGITNGFALGGESHKGKSWRKTRVPNERGT